MKKNNDKKNKFYCSLELPFFLILYLLLGMLSTYLVFFVDIWSPPITTKQRVITFIMLTIVPWVVFIWSVITYWRIIEITETGVKSSLFKKLLVKELTWNEINDIRLIPIQTGGVWLFFSKTSLKGMSIGKARRQKDQIQVLFSNKIQDAVEMCCNKEIHSK